MQATHALCMPYIFSFFLLLDLSYPITEYHMDIICLCNIMQRQSVHAGNSCTVHALHFFPLSFVRPIISHNRISYGYHMFMQYNAEAKGPCRQLMHCACLTFFSFFLLLDLSYHITEYHMDIICLCNIMQRQSVHAGNSCTVHALHFFFLSFVGPIISHNRISYGYHMFMQYNAEAKCPCRQLMHCACLTFFPSFFC